MLLERTIAQLDIGPIDADEAIELGQLGYLQWMAGLPARADYLAEAMHAYRIAQPFIRASPAVAVFCDLLVRSTRRPFEPLALNLLTGKRRGGTQGRRDRRHMHW